MSFYFHTYMFQLVRMDGKVLKEINQFLLSMFFFMFICDKLS